MGFGAKPQVLDLFLPSAGGTVANGGRAGALPSRTARGTTMQQSLIYRDCRYVIGPENDRGRSWTIFPEDGPEKGAAGGTARGEGLRGSFKVAVHTAQEAIDRWLAAGSV